MKIIFIFFMIVINLNFILAESVSVSEAKTIEKYYELISEKKLEEAYKLSNKTIDLNKYKSWYKNTEFAYITELENIDTNLYQVKVVLCDNSNDAYSLFYYNVIFTMENGEIKSTKPTNISHEINSSDLYHSIKNSDFNYNEFDTIGGGLELFDNTYQWVAGIIANGGIFFVIKDTIYFREYNDKNNGFIVKKRSIVEDKTSLVSKYNIMDNDKMVYCSSIQPDQGKIRHYQGKEITIVDSTLFDYDFSNNIYYDIKKFNIISFFKGKNDQWDKEDLNTYVLRKVIGYSEIDGELFYLITGSHDHHYNISYYVDDKIINDNLYFIGWIKGEDIKNKL